MSLEAELTKEYRLAVDFIHETGDKVSIQSEEKLHQGDVFTLIAKGQDEYRLLGRESDPAPVVKVKHDVFGDFFELHE